MSASSRTDALAAAKPHYAMVYTGQNATYENRREGDRVMQEAMTPIRSNQFNAYAYSPETFPAASPALIAPVQVRARADVPLPTPAPDIAEKAEARAVETRADVPLPQPRPRSAPSARRMDVPRPYQRPAYGERFSRR